MRRGGFWGVVQLKLKEREEGVKDGKKAPLGLPLGNDAWALIKGDVDAFPGELDVWRSVSGGVAK